MKRKGLLFMLKIKDIFIQKLYRTDLSNFEQQILFELTFRCDETGSVKGIYYKEIIEKIGCSVARFYNVLANLEEKDFILCDRDTTYYGDWNIQIFSNDFTNDKLQTAKYSRFSNFNIEMFNKDEFKNLKAGARRLLIYIAFRVLKQKYNQENKGMEENKRNHLKYTPKINKYKTMSKEIGITERACKEYAEELSKAGFISIGNNIDVNSKPYDIITLLASVLKTPVVEATAKGKIVAQKRNNLHAHFEHFVKTICRRNKINTNTLNLTDTAILLMQYKDKALKKGKDIYTIVRNAIKSLSDDLSSRIIHCIIKELIEKDYNESILIF